MTLDPRYSCPHCGMPLEVCDEPPVQDDCDRESFRGQVELK